MSDIAENDPVSTAVATKDRRALTSPENGKLGGRPVGTGRPLLATRMRAEAALRDARLSAANLTEMIARGAFYDPRDYYYAEDDTAVHESDGPVVEGCTEGEKFAPRQWRKGDPMNRWQKGDLKPVSELTEAQAQAIVGMKVVMKNATAGDGKIDRVLEYKFAPRDKYVELGAKYRGMLVDQVDVRITDAGTALDKARARARERNLVIDVTPRGTE